MERLLADREILVAGIKELLGLADEYGADLKRRREFIAEATRLGVRLVEVQKKLEDGLHE